MKCTKIFYQRTKSLPGYHNKTVGIEIELEQGEKAIDVLRKAEVFISNALDDKISPQQIDAFKSVQENNKWLNELPF